MGSEEGTGAIVGSAPERNALAGLAVSVGESCSASANRPLELDGRDAVWLVESGALDLSIAEYEDGAIRSAFKHLLRLEPGRLAFGVGAEALDNGLQLVAKGLRDTRLRRIPLDLLMDAVAKETGASDLADTLVAEIDAWVGGFAAAVAGSVDPRPPAVLRIAPGQPPDELQTGVLFADRGVVWLRGAPLDAGFLQLEDARPAEPGLVPVTQDAWTDLRDLDAVTCLGSRDLGLDTLLGDALAEFHRLAFGAEAGNRRLQMVDEANLQMARLSRRRRDEEQARRELASLSARRRETSVAPDGALAAALGMLGRHEGFDIRVPDPVQGQDPMLAEIVALSGLRVRLVRLDPEDQWWLGDSGAMLALRGEDQRPVVLLPGASGRYRVLDPQSGRSERAGAATGLELGEQAWFIYRTLPTDRAVGLKDLFDVAKGSLAGDLVRLAAAGIGAGVLALAPAVAADILVASVIPSGEAGALIRFAAVLAGAALVGALFHVLRGTALMRLEGRIAARVSAAVWDRLLRLRPAFFRGRTAGDLATRAMAFQTLRDTVAGAASDGLLSTLFLLPMFALIFFYDVALGWLTLGFGLAILVTTAVLALCLVDPQRRYFDMARRLAGDLLQFLNGIAKLRGTGAEASAFAAWAKNYWTLKQAEIRLSMLTEHVTAFSAAVPALGGAALFAVALHSDIEVSEFLAIYTASMVFYMAVVMLGQSLQAAASVIPGCEQVQPILEAETDTVSHGRVRPVLQGDIAFQRVSFRYGEDSPMVLHDVSIHTRPGEFVAIVGESGSGKSTLFRLALGLEEPTSGAVYYDGQDHAQLDRDAVRRQIGAVTQDSGLLGGSVLNNIIGVSKDLTVDDAWRAARQANVDRDIAAMPMGMFTLMGENAGTFSGGQNQRIRIAAALVHNPRILFLDEPTSWLDTKSQAETMKGIERSVNTRIVIAHRLSTIRNANRIYVLKAGRVVQVGDFEELIARDGPFRELARRQML